MDAHISIEDNVLAINGFSTAHKEIVDYFKEIPEEKRNDHLQAMILAGVTTFKTIGTAEKIDYIEKSFNKFNYIFDKRIEKTLGEKGIFTDKMQEAFGENGLFDKKINETLGEKGFLNEKIEETFGENGSIVKEILNPNREGTPLYQLKTELKDVMKDIQKTLEKEEGREEALSNTTFKGFSFEDVCEQLLSDIAKSQDGDYLEKTADQPGLLAPSKKGDFVVTIGSQPETKIVFEIKDVNTLSVPKIHEQLDESIENRGADYGVIVFRFVESLPNCVGWFKEYYGNKLVIALGTQDHEEFLASELMHVAYIWARTKVKQQETQQEMVNIIPIVQEKMKKITDSLKKFSQLKSHCTHMDNTVSEIRRLVETIEREINDQLTELGNEVRKGMEENDGEDV
jgi:hypothetical protein